MLSEGYKELLPLNVASGMWLRYPAMGQNRRNPEEERKSFHAILHAAHTRVSGVAHRGKHQNHEYGRYVDMAQAQRFLSMPQGHLREAVPFPEPPCEQKLRSERHGAGL